MSTTSVEDWLLEEATADSRMFAKRLAGNDTLATGSHQAGPYIGKEFLFALFPELGNPKKLNPELHLVARVNSSEEERRVRVVWYNNRLHGSGTRNETRITQWGGIQSPVLDPDNTGSVAVFSFHADEKRLSVWVAKDVEEESAIEAYLGEVEPGCAVEWPPRGGLSGTVSGGSSCRLTASDIPAAWLKKFPSGIEIIEKAFRLRPPGTSSPDDRLIRRRDCELEVFRSIESAFESPRVALGYPTLDAFISHAQQVLQRRKSRSGRSLELHTLKILEEEGFVKDSTFAHNVTSEGKKKPDFLFPNADAYRDSTFPASSLRMLAVKTTCKDRWRQVLNEADRIAEKHLLTLQEGVSENQFREMEASGIKLVVPKPLISSFPKTVRPHLLDLQSFLTETARVTKT